MEIFFPDLGLFPRKEGKRRRGEAPWRRFFKLMEDKREEEAYTKLWELKERGLR
jgi:hypothetical protein